MPHLLDAKVLNSHQVKSDRHERGCFMKLVLLALVLLVAGCAPAQLPNRSGPVPYGPSTGAETGSGSVTSQTTPPNSYGKDAVDCERKAALAGIGSKGEAFSSCMKARGHTPGR
jgi:hypothetical protein